MTEKINVKFKTAMNRLHAVLAFLFWVALGIVAGKLVSEIVYEDVSAICAVAGILIGIVRLFVINDKYAWQVATLEEIEKIQKTLEAMNGGDIKTEQENDE